MTGRKALKITLVAGLVFLALELPWFIGIQIIANRTLVKTTATVVVVVTGPADCTGDKPGQPDATCDHSDRTYPVYEYYDQSGKRYVQDDRYLGEYKQNNPLIKLFGKQKGDKVPAYYTKGKPTEVTFMSSVWAYTAWLIPLFISLFILFISFVIFVALLIESKSKKKHHKAAK